MAAAAPFVKLLRQLSAARDDYRTGALDITWDGGQASLFLVFGQPNHAILQTADGKRLEGQDALTGLVSSIPPRFQISPWRKEVVRSETLRCTIDDLMEPFAQLAGSAPPNPPAPDLPTLTREAVTEVDFGLDDFPLLPLGTTLWADAAASVVHLDVLVPTLPDTLVVLTGSRLRAAGIVSHQRMVDAVWVDDETRSSGDEAIMAMMGASQGSISGYRLEAPGLGEALPMLWRFPVAQRGVPLAWIDPSGFLGDLESRPRDCAITVAGRGGRGVALWVGGALLAVYSEGERQPTASLERFRDLLRAPSARLTMRQHPDGEPVHHLPEASFHAFVAPASALPPISTAEPVGAPALVAAEPAADPEAVAETRPPAAAGAIPGRVEADGTEVDAAASGESPAEADGVPVWPEPQRLSATEDIISSAAAASPVGAETVATAPPPGQETASRLSGESVAPIPWEVDEATDGTDFEGVKKDLTQIVTLWLGSESAATASELIERARPTVGDIMATIDAIAALPLPGHEPSVIQAMGREMRFHAAEYLSGV